jgi:hypothetical protein
MIQKYVYLIKLYNLQQNSCRECLGYLLLIISSSLNHCTVLSAPISVKHTHCGRIIAQIFLHIYSTFFFIDLSM